MTQLLFGHDETVAKWVAGRLNAQFYGVVLAVGIIADDGGPLLGGAVLHSHTKTDVELSVYAPGVCSIRLIKVLIEYGFNVLHVERGTCRVRRRDKHIRRALPKLGWREEGVMRHLYGPYHADDGFVFGFLRQDAVRYGIVPAQMRKAA